MNAVVAQLPRAVVPVPMPVVMKAIGVEGPLRGRPQPKIVVDALRNCRVVLVADAGPVTRDPGAREGDLAELSRTHEFRGTGKLGGAAPLGADLHDAIVLAGGLNHAPAFHEIVRDRFLHVDVFPRLASPDRGQ